MVRVIDIDHYFDRFIAEEGMVPGQVEATGRAYRLNGYLERDQLYTLVHAVSPRSARYVDENLAEDCRDATQDAYNTPHDASKIAVLCGLRGIKVPTASYVLTALDPLNHAIVNSRVWASLHYLGYVDNKRATLTPADYATAIQHIRSIADEEECTAAAVGYALAAHGADVRNRETPPVTAPERIPLEPADAPVPATR